jgi:hypothetical protein
LAASSQHLRQRGGWYLFAAAGILARPQRREITIAKAFRLCA